VYDELSGLLATGKIKIKIFFFIALCKEIFSYSITLILKIATLGLR